MQVVLHMSKVVKLAKIESWSTWETTWNQIFFIPSLPSACLLFLLYCLLFLSFKEIGKVWLGEVNLFFCPHHPPLFSPKKRMYDLSFHHLLALLIDFSNSWAPRQIWKLLYAPMGDLLRFSKPVLTKFEWKPLILWNENYILWTRTLPIKMMIFAKKNTKNTPQIEKCWYQYTRFFF